MNLDQNKWNTYYSQSKDFGLITSQSISKILEYTDPVLEKSCLDIGCGTGQLTRELYHRGYSCVGIDLSKEAIKIAESLTVVPKEKLSYKLHDFESEEIPSLFKANYSLITCKLVYAFIKNKTIFLSKVKKILNSGGIFVIITPITSPPEDRRPIEVSLSDTLEELSEFFEIIDHYPGVGVTYIICKSK